MKVLIALNEAPYGSERAYNALRLAASLSRREGVAVRVFLVGDAAACAKRGQSVPSGYYNVEHMISVVVRHGEVGVCGSCMEARGITEFELVEGAQKRTLDVWTTWTIEADRVLVF